MAVFTVQIDDKASGASEVIANKLGSMISQLQGAGVAVDQINVKMGGAASKASGMSAKFSEAITSTSGLENAAAGLGEALNPVTLAIAAVTAAAVAAIAVLTGMALALYEGAVAAIRFSEMRAGITSSLEAMTGNGKAVVAMLDDLGQRLPFTTERMADWSTKLAAAGVRDLPGLQRGVQAASAATALFRDQTDGTAQKVVGLISKFSELGETGASIKIDKRLGKQLASVGVDMNDLASELGTTADKLNGAAIPATKLGDALQDALIHKGKGALEQFGSESSQIWTKFKEGISSLFEDVSPGVQKFMGEVRLFALEFSNGSASADASKSVITSVFTTLFDWATTAVHAIHVFFLEFEIAALSALIAMTPAINTLRQFWNEHNGSGKLITLLEGVAVVLGIIAVAALVASIPLLVLGAALGLIVYIIGEIAEGIAGVGKRVDAVKGWASAAYSAASGFIGGIISGIGDGIGAVGYAVAKLGDHMVQSIKETLRIHSPSLVMVDVGLNVARGLAGGISQGQEGVAAAARGLGGSAVGGAVSTSSNTRGGDTNITANLTINNYGGGDMGELAEQGFGSLLERVAMQIGIAPAPLGAAP